MEWAPVIFNGVPYGPEVAVGAPMIYDGAPNALEGQHSTCVM